MAKKAVSRAARAAANGKPHTKTKAKPTTATGIKVYSYIRFSTPEQAEGDSERRQVEAAKKWAEQHGYTFDESLKADRGVPGFKGQHRKKGNLGRFLKWVQNGEVPRGSILVVEELRRLTREGLYVGLREIFEKLWDAGIAIQTLTPEFTYTREECDNNIAASVSLTILLQLAKEESEQKSRWLKAANERKRRDARINKALLTNMAPLWLEYEKPTKEDEPRRLRLDRHGKPIANPAAVSAIRQAFKLKVKRLGNAGISETLNQTATWSPPDGWTATYVQRVLKNREVLGEFQLHKKIAGKRVPEGDPILDYFPKIVAEDLFNRVQQILAETKGIQRGGRNDKGSNVLQHLVQCGYCKGPIHYHPGAGDYNYLVCVRKRKGHKIQCRKPAPSFRYDECENAVLKHCRQLKPELILPNPSAAAKRATVLRSKIDEKAATLAETANRTANLQDQIEITANAEQRTGYEKRVITLKADLVQQEADIAKLRQQLQQLEKAKTTFTAWQAQIATLHEALKSGDVAIRHRLNGHLHDFIEKIELFSHGHADPDDDEFSEWLDANESEAGVHFRSGRVRTEFVQWAMAKRASKRGRFLRIYYKMSPKKIKFLKGIFGDDEPLFEDIIPEGSIGGETSLDPLLEEFLKTRKKRAVR